MDQNSIDIEIAKIDALKRGDTKALSYFFNNYYPPLCLFATRLIGETGAAEDIAGESFVKLWDRRTDFQTEQNIKAFLYITTRNACMDFYRKSQRQAQSKKDLTYIIGDDMEDETVMENEMIRAAVLGEIYKEIENLPLRARQIFKLSYIDGMKNQEIADEMGIAINTVKNQKARAIQLLRGMMLKKDVWGFSALALLLSTLLRRN
ncbi:RNA polymerase sigma factor [Chitinophaga solisilvae]|uniref:RNA polymerase sigma-70 factor n=1 Tax=Chitinophaga solisilvae TaxID=1233460 RepID=A0A433WHY3_9BACT|nr:RNA polymerase sigma-70 factor [Chitinophaga solisilvae]NSL87390.1 RNA polymerase sigma-70 factor [Chitinophaga solisilvae]